MRSLLLLSTLFLTLLSCERTLMPKNPSNDAPKNFDILCNTISERYAYFELKGVNWDSLRQVHEPRVHQGMDPEKLFAIMDSMLLQLRDGHVNLESSFNLSRYSDFYLGAPENFDFTTVQRNYLGKDHRIAGGLRYTILEDSVGYIYFGSFSSSLSEENLDAALHYLRQTKGLILDIRNNGGGSLGTTFRLARRFIPGSKKVLQRRYKQGPGRNDFSPSEITTLEAYPGLQYLKGMVLLTNRRCYSAANTFTAIMSQLDRVHILGDTTGGGAGIPVDHELPNGWRYRFSASQERTADGREMENGLAPDQVLYLDRAHLLNGTDDIIEEALDRLR